MNIKKFLLATGASCVGFLGLANAALLGVDPGFPNIVYNNQGQINYDSGTGALNVDATALNLTFTSGGSPAFVVAPNSVTIRIFANSTCDVTGGNPSGSDLVVTGTVFDQFGTLLKSGVLLTGDIVDMGEVMATASISDFDFVFTNAGGLLVTDGDWPAGQDIGLVLNSEGSNFGGDCSTTFTGGAKGDIGPIDTTPVEVCDLTLVKTAMPDTIGPFLNNDSDTDSDSGHDNDGSGDSDDSDSDSEADSADSDPVPPPCGCKGRVKQLTMRYNLQNANLVEVRRKNGQVLYGPTLLQPGEEFTFAVKGRKIKFLVNMERVARLRTSCKHPIGSGQPIGPNSELIVVSGVSKLKQMVPLCPYPGSTCDLDHQVTYNYEITNNGSAVDSVVVFDDPLGVIGSTIPTIPGISSAPNNVVNVQTTACIFENTVNTATATGNQLGVGCASNEAQETVTVLQDCPLGDTDSDSGNDWNGNGDTDDSDSDSGARDCDFDEPISCFGGDTDSDSGIDSNNNNDSDDSDSDSGPLDCNNNGH